MLWLDCLTWIRAKLAEKAARKAERERLAEAGEFVPIEEDEEEEGEAMFDDGDDEDGDDDDDDDDDVVSLASQESSEEDDVNGDDSDGSESEVVGDDDDDGEDNSGGHSANRTMIDAHSGGSGGDMVFPIVTKVPQHELKLRQAASVASSARRPAQRGASRESQVPATKERELQPEHSAAKSQARDSAAKHARDSGSGHRGRGGERGQRAGQGSGEQRSSSVRAAGKMRGESGGGRGGAGWLGRRGGAEGGGGDFGSRGGRGDGRNMSGVGNGVFVRPTRRAAMAVRCARASDLLLTRTVQLQTRRGVRGNERSTSCGARRGLAWRELGERARRCIAAHARAQPRVECECVRSGEFLNALSGAEPFVRKARAGCSA